MADYQQKPLSGSLFPNEKKSSATAPDYTGTFIDANGRQMRAALWVKCSQAGKQYLSLQVSEFQQQAAGPIVQQPVAAPQAQPPQPPQAPQAPQQQYQQQAPAPQYQQMPMYQGPDMPA